MQTSIKFLCCSFILLAINFSCQKEAPGRFGVFAFDQKVTLPGAPEVIYDAITGDISGWWDHSFVENPCKFYIEPKPGGGFYEIFNANGDGVLHATVIAAERGKLLRFDGPLGLGRTRSASCYHLPVRGRWRFHPPDGFRAFRWRNRR